MVDLQDRRYFAQCTQHLSSASLALLLDTLLVNYPNEVVERKGFDSYHIDFGMLSEPAFSTAKMFIKQALKDDDEVQDAIVRQDSITSLPSLPGAAASSASLGAGLSNVLELESLVLGKQPVNGPASTPTLPYPTAPVQKSPTSDPSSLNSISVEPDKSSTRRTKRMRKSESSDDHSTVSGNTQTARRRGGSSRYYNGERVLRQESQDQTFTFHGVQVVLLGQQVNTNRPWKCLLCDKSFVSKDKIMNHIQLHSGEKTHECPVCHERYSSRHYLKEHQKRVHSHDCHQCNRVFPSFEEYHEHTIKEHSELGEGLCGCQKGCDNSRCSCFKNGLVCSSRCHCRDCRNKTAT